MTAGLTDAPAPGVPSADALPVYWPAYSGPKPVRAV